MGRGSTDRSDKRSAGGTTPPPTACSPGCSPGSLPGLRSGTNAQPSAMARGAPKIRPRASKPAAQEAGGPSRRPRDGAGRCSRTATKTAQARWRRLLPRGSCHGGGRTCHHVHLPPLVALRQQVDRVLECLWVQQDGGHVLELDPGLGEVRDHADGVVDALHPRVVHADAAAAAHGCGSTRQARGSGGGCWARGRVAAGQDAAMCAACM